MLEAPGHQDAAAAARAPPPPPGNPVARALLQRVEGRLRGLRRLPLQLLDLVPLPSPAPDLDALRVRCFDATGRVPQGPDLVQCGGDAFLRAAALEAAVDAPPEEALLDAYVRTQRCAVARLATQGWVVPGDAARAHLARDGASWEAALHAWAAATEAPGGPWDALALQLWSLLNAKTVVLVGAGSADDDDAPPVLISVEIVEGEELYDGCTLGVLPGPAFVGLLPLEYELQPPPPLPQQGKRRVEILNYGCLPEAAYGNDDAARSFIGMPKWRTACGPDQSWAQGTPFIIGDGYKSIASFRSSEDPRVMCPHTCEVSSALSPDGSATFIITPADGAPPVHGTTLGMVTRLLKNRVLSAMDQLSPESRLQLRLGQKSDFNGKGFFGFSSKAYLERNEDLDPDRLFARYWEVKACVDAGRKPPKWMRQMPSGYRDGRRPAQPRAPEQGASPPASRRRLDAHGAFAAGARADSSDEDDDGGGADEDLEEAMEVDSEAAPSGTEDASEEEEEEEEEEETSYSALPPPQQQQQPLPQPPPPEVIDLTSDD